MSEPLTKIVRIPGLSGRWVEIDYKYDYENNKTHCPVCGDIGIPWAGWFNCESGNHKSIIGDGRTFAEVRELIEKVDI